MSIKFCWDNGGYLAELSTEKKDTDINPHLDRNKYYWIGLKRRGQLVGYGDFHWSESGKRSTYTTWWEDFDEPNGNGNCVFKDSYQQDDPKQFGWADYGCNKNFWKKDIHALCEIPNPRNPRLGGYVSPHFIFREIFQVE